MPHVVEAKRHGALEELNGLAWGQALGGTGGNSERFAYAFGAWRARTNARVSKGAGHAQRDPNFGRVGASALACQARVEGGADGMAGQEALHVGLGARANRTPGAFVDHI